MTICSMSVFRNRNSPVIPRPLHNSATKRSTTLPIELISDQRDMSVAGYKNAQVPSLERKQGKRRITSLKLCNMKLDYTSRLMGVNTCAVEELNPAPHIHEQMTTSNYGYDIAYNFTHNNIMLEHNAMNNKNTVAHMDVHNTQY